LEIRQKLAFERYIKELPPPFEIKYLKKGTYLIKNPYSGLE